MKRIIAVIIIIVFTLTIFAEAGSGFIPAERNPFHTTNRSSRDFVTIISEDFESGAEGWETFDATGVSPWIESWHLSTAGAYEGNSWWMGDEELGGYTDHRYLVLDTPELVLAEEDPELNFMFSLSCEDTGGEPPYNAWDGANVRISTDGGNTWTPIEGTPEYNGTSFYSFGYEFNEGVNIPGWGSTTEWVTWTEANFDLSAYAGDEVKLRFAFASDSAYNTADDASMFGFRLDDIAIDTSTGIFESNGDGASGDSEMIAGYGAVSTGDLWHIYEDSEAPSPTHAVGCFDENTDTYLPGMDNSITTPAFYLPAGGNFTWDVDVKLMLDDDSTFPNCDYLIVEKCYQIPGEDWSSWYLISYPAGSPDIEGFAFTGNSDTWVPFFGHWSFLYRIISDYAGRNMKLRFRLRTNDENEVVPGGFRIDNFIVQQEIYHGPAPRNLIATANEDQQVELNWDAITEGGSEGWIQWDNGVNDSAVGLNYGGTLKAAARFDDGDMMPYLGGEITQLELYIADLPEEMIVHIWSGALAQNELLNQPYNPVANNWNLIDLDTPILIESNTDYWIGYEVTIDEFSNSAGLDAGPAVAGKGDYYSIDQGIWQELHNVGLDQNWNIHAYIEAEELRLPLFPNSCREREVTGYNVYRSTESGINYENIGTCAAIDTPYFLDEDPVISAWNYYKVAALYDSLDGAFSDEDRAYILDDDLMELAYDDGSSEEGFNVGIVEYMAVKFTPPCNYTRSISYLKLYIETLNTGTFVFRILEGSSGFPGERIAQFAITPENLNPGWNIIDFPEVTIPDSTSECFFISIFEMANLSAIGKDTDSAGNSWITAGEEHEWSEITDGNLLIRTFIFPIDGSDAMELAPATASISNYPNPFNPETTIQFELAQKEQVLLEIFNIKGQKVATLAREEMERGQHYLSWNAESEAAGIYLIRLRTNNEQQMKKLVLLK